MACVEVLKPDQSVGVGTAFHVGEGVFVTARHLVENALIKSVSTTCRCQVRLEGEEAERSLHFVRRGDETFKVHEVYPRSFEVGAGPFFDEQGGEDIAVFRVREYDPRLPVIPLGGHLDDWLSHDAFVLSGAIVLGYPPIPMTISPVLVAARAEVNALVELRTSKHPHFLLSAMARGGLSGGVALSEYGFALGVVTSSLVRNSVEAELGYLSVLTVEPILNCLAAHKLLPDIQADGWEGLFTRDSISVGKEEPLGEQLTAFLSHASVGIVDDGKRLALDVVLYMPVPNAAKAFSAALDVLSTIQVHVTTREHTHFEVTNVGKIDSEARRLFLAAREAALQVLERELGFVRRAI